LFNYRQKYGSHGWRLILLGNHAKKDRLSKVLIKQKGFINNNQNLAIEDLQIRRIYRLSIS